MSFKLLIINPGSTSTKVALYEDINSVFVESISHTTQELDKYPCIIDQLEFRKHSILERLKERNCNLNEVDAIVCRGGLLKPIISGTYLVNEAMLRDLSKLGCDEHACNLGAILGNEIARDLGINAYIVDPVVVDEMQSVARISGMKEVERKSIFHALNQKAVAKRYAKEINKPYNELNLVVVHLGGGISVGAHCLGKVIDVNNALDGEGPFTPERTGTIPVGQLIKMCYSGKYTLEEMKKKITGKGGLVSYFNTNDVRKVLEMANGLDSYAKLIIDAMCYQIAKEIGKYSVVLYGKVDSIILTGGIAHSKEIVKNIEDRVKFISKVVVYPGEDEMLALAEGGYRALNGYEEVKIYE